LHKNTLSPKNGTVVLFYTTDSSNNKVANDGLASVPHEATELVETAIISADQQDQQAAKKDEEESHPKSDRSVLQTKLTRLAIQIGYGGEMFFMFVLCFCFISVLFLCLLRYY